MRSATPPTDSRHFRLSNGLRVLVIAVTCVSLAGCRSGRSTRSMVQITEEPSAVISNLPAPEQRLATTFGKRSPTKRTSNSATNVDLASAVAGMPEVFQAKSAESNAKTVSGSTNSDPQESAVANSDSNPEPVVEPVTKPGNSPASQEPDSEEIAVATHPDTKTVAVSDDDIEVSFGGLVSASLTDLTVPSESVASTSTAPSSPAENTTDTAADEELVVSTSGKRPPIRHRTNTQTDVPNGLNKALKKSLAELPQLPKAKLDSSGLIPRRIGAGKPKIASDQPEPKFQDVVVAETAIDEHESSMRRNANQVRTVSHDLENTQIDTAIHEQAAINERAPTELPSRELSEAGLSETELYGELLQRISQAPADETPIDRERRQIIAFHLMVLAGDPESAVMAMEGLCETEQHYMKNQLMGLWTMIDPNGHPSSGRRITAALPKFREATRYMAAATDSLTLNHLEFCTEIESYGLIKPFEGNRFSAGQQVLLYCEVENFSAADHNGQFKTQIHGSYDIYDSAGSRVISQLLPVEEQRSRNRLRDYFVAYQMNLPKTLSTGTYRLQLTLEDTVGKKYGQQNIPFEIR